VEAIADVGTSLAEQIEELFASESLPETMPTILEEIIAQLATGNLKVVEKNEAGIWQTNFWLKKALQLYLQFVSQTSTVTSTSATAAMESLNACPIPDKHFGSFVGRGTTIISPSIINIGAYVDAESMIDSLVSIGSCAYIGKNVRIGSGTIIGGSLLDTESQPVIIEDQVFIGGNCGIYEGTIIESGSVIGSGTIITANTQVIDAASGEQFLGRVPQNSVVVPGTSKAGDSPEFVLQTPLIVKKVLPPVVAPPDYLSIFRKN
jgi:2,3,4,5-tetrahydropyridine-2-carboxylate N-succinyltransferase